ncbi:MAG: 30S ribosomal protein S17 [Chloroflexi bacterium]|nr:30S ribosomal protein S17 [Chloroflexota bacterium]
MSHHKFQVGRVVGDKMAKTVVVEVGWVQHHKLYKKAIRRVTRLYAHDAEGQCKLGDMVRVVEVRPISKTKRWLVKEVVRRGQVAELPADEVGVETASTAVPGPTEGSEAPAAEAASGAVPMAQAEVRTQAESTTQAAAKEEPQ